METYGNIWKYTDFLCFFLIYGNYHENYDYGIMEIYGNIPYMGLSWKYGDYGIVIQWEFYSHGGIVI